MHPATERGALIEVQPEKTVWVWKLAQASQAFLSAILEGLFSPWLLQRV